MRNFLLLNHHFYFFNILFSKNFCFGDPTPILEAEYVWQLPQLPSVFRETPPHLEAESDLWFHFFQNVAYDNGQIHRHDLARVIHWDPRLS